jgi:hypothetical protein
MSSLYKDRPKKNNRVITSIEIKIESIIVFSDWYVTKELHRLRLLLLLFLVTTWGCPSRVYEREE